MSTPSQSRSSLQAHLAAFAHDTDGSESTNAYRQITEPESYESQAYSNFLNNLGATTLGLIQARESVLNAYATYAPDVSQLLADIDSHRREHGNAAVWRRADFVGSGGFAQVFALETNGQKVAVRRAAQAPTFDYLIATTLRANGIPQTEEIIAASYDDAVTISSFVEGTPLHKLSSKELSEVTNNQIEQLLDTATKLGNKLVTVDANAGNFIYDRAAGFCIIDFRPQNLRRIRPSVSLTNVSDTIDMFNGIDVQPNSVGQRMLDLLENRNDRCFSDAGNKSRSDQHL